MDNSEEERKQQKKLKKEAKRQREAEEIVDMTEEEQTQYVEFKKLKKEEKKKKKEFKLLQSKSDDVSSEVDGLSKGLTNDNVNELANQSHDCANNKKETTTIDSNVLIQVYPESDGIENPSFSSFNDFYNAVGNGNPSTSVFRNYANSKSFSKPSPIQAYCWPLLLKNKDVIGIASTGSGKTLAFLLPALHKLAQRKASGIYGNNNQSKYNKNGNHNKPSPKILVLAPTRELAMQSYQVAADIGTFTSVCVYGGVSKQAQLSELRSHQSSSNGLDVVIATPGRLLDYIQENSISLQVLDEADRMLDEGFEPAIRQIIGVCPGIDQRQTVMFSATWPEEIRVLGNKYLNCNNTTRVVVGSEELAANHRVTQIVEVLENNSRTKDQRLFQLLQNYHKSRTNKILIFVLYKKEAVTLQNTIQARGYNVTAIHGDKSQYDRTAALESFRNGSIPLLIATDVAARGLDIPNVEYVINYSFPLTVEDYVHRIGRTGRAGKTGCSHTFFTDFDKALAGGLVGVLQEAKQAVPQDIYKFPMITKKKTSKLYGDFGPRSSSTASLASVGSTGSELKKATKITFDNDE